MIFLKNNPKGIDKTIQTLQQHLYNALSELWGIQATEYKCFGRAYRNKDEQGRYVPECYYGRGYVGKKEYDDPLTDDRITLTSFFGESSLSKIDNQYSVTNVHLIFCLDLSKLKPAIIHRADEEIHQDIFEVLNQYPFGFKIISTELWLDAVFKEYSGYKTQDGMAKSDTHPYHCFRVNLEMRYQNSNC